MRYDAEEHLAHWRATGGWPAIHDNIANMAIGHMWGDCLLDLGCAYGLLGSRIAKFSGARAVGVEASKALTDAAISAGVNMSFYNLKVTGDTLPTLEGIIKAERVTTLVCRRILPELWGDDQIGAMRFMTTIAYSGIREVFVEGRVPTSKAVNRLSSIEAEIEMLSSHYSVRTRTNAVAYLIRA